MDRKGGGAGRRTDAPVLIGIDVGTSSIRAVAFDARGGKLGSGSRPTPMRPAETGGEYDPDELWSCVLAVLAEVGALLAGRPVAGIAVASFGETAVLVDKGGRAVAPSIVWHDRRTEPLVAEIGEKVGAERVFGLTGHAIQHFFTLAKLIWMRGHNPEAIESTDRILMMADWIAYRLSGEAATDPSLASRTLYFDIGERQWSDEMLALAGLDSRTPAPVRGSASPLGLLRADVAEETGIAGRPVIGVGGHDHIVGAFATGLSEPGTVVDSIGTAEAMLLGTDAPLHDPEVLRRGYVQGAVEADRRMDYLGAGLFSSGGSIEWARAVLGGRPMEELIAEAGKEPAGCQGVLFLPHMGGGAPPVPDPNGAGAFFGLSVQTTPARLYRAVLEGLAMQSRMMLDGMTSLPGVGAPKEIRLIGGVSRNRLFLSIKADVLGRPVVVVEEPEATALGAALLGGVAAGVFPSLRDAVAGLDRKESIVDPGPDEGAYERLRTLAFEPIHANVSSVNRGRQAFLSGHPAM